MPHRQIATHGMRTAGLPEVALSPGADIAVPGDVQIACCQVVRAGTAHPSGQAEISQHGMGAAVLIIGTITPTPDKRIGGGNGILSLPQLRGIIGAGTIDIQVPQGGVVILMAIDNASPRPDYHVVTRIRNTIEIPVKVKIPGAGQRIVAGTPDPGDICRPPPAAPAGACVYVCKFYSVFRNLPRSIQYLFHIFGIIKQP